VIASAGNVECVLDAKAELGEGPVWDPDAACLYFVDITRGLVHRYDPDTQASRSHQINAMVGAVALTTAGDLVLAVRDGFARLDPGSGRVRRIASVDADRPDRRMNDGKCDPAGRFWAGTMAIDERGGAGALYRLDPDGRVHMMLDEVRISNGLDWSDDGRLMYYVDTPTRSIDVFDFDVTTGAIANRRSLACVASGEGWPDGLTLDADGFVWVALWAGAAVRRYAPDGTLDRILTVPASHPTSCAFGGRDLRDLYITTAATPLTSEERRRTPLAGGLFRCRPGVQGRAANRFRG
jgi:sugar lactone lactonase YvrE